MLGLAAEEEAQRATPSDASGVSFEPVEITRRRTEAGSCGEPDVRGPERRLHQGRRLDRERPERHRVARAEPARLVADRVGLQLGPRGDRVSRRGLDLLGVEPRTGRSPSRGSAPGSAGYRTSSSDSVISGNSSSILRADPRRQVGERLDEPFHVRVVGVLRVDPQPLGDLGVVLGELRGELADVGELALVVRQELVTHGTGPSPRRCRSRG